jgi:isopentenyl phosphate kinase
MFVLVEQSPGAFTLRFVANDELIEDLSKQGALQVFLDDVDGLYADFRKRFPDAPIMTRPKLTEREGRRRSTVVQFGA